jgi:hypothetical protein
MLALPGAMASVRAGETIAGVIARWKTAAGSPPTAADRAVPPPDDPTRRAQVAREAVARGATRAAAAGDVAGVRAALASGAVRHWEYGGWVEAAARRAGRVEAALALGWPLEASRGVASTSDADITCAHLRSSRSTLFGEQIDAALVDHPAFPFWRSGAHGRASNFANDYRVAARAARARRRAGFAVTGPGAVGMRTSLAVNTEMVVYMDGNARLPTAAQAAMRHAAGRDPWIAWPRWRDAAGLLRHTRHRDDAGRFLAARYLPANPFCLRMVATAARGASSLCIGIESAARDAGQLRALAPIRSADPHLGPSMTPFAVRALAGPRTTITGVLLYEFTGVKRMGLLAAEFLRLAGDGWPFDVRATLAVFRGCCKQLRRLESGERLPGGGLSPALQLRLAGRTDDPSDSPDDGDIWRVADNLESLRVFLTYRLGLWRRVAG